jgi:hypothetical protein
MRDRHFRKSMKARAAGESLVIVASVPAPSTGLPRSGFAA